MTTKWLDPGGNATFGTEFLDTAGGVTVSSAVTHNGQPRSYLLPGAAGADGILSRSGVIGVTRRISFWFYSDLASSSDLVAVSSASANAFLIHTNANGNFNVYTGTGTSLGLSGPPGTLSANSWTQMVIAYRITSATSFQVSVWVNGTLIGTATDSATLVTAAPDRLLLIHSSSTVYLSELYVDDVNNPTGFPGVIYVTAKSAANVDADTFDTTGGTGAINERPKSETNYRAMAASSAGQVTRYDLLTDGDQDLTGHTIVDACSWMWAKRGSGGAPTWSIENPDNTSTSVTLTTTSALYISSFTGPSGSRFYSGILISVGGGADTFLYETGSIVASIPPVAVPHKLLPRYGQAVPRAATR